MLIIYNKVSGEVVENQGIIEGFPYGLPNHEFVIEKVIERVGGSMIDYGVIRLHDIEDAGLIAKTSTHEYTIQNGEIVFGELKPIPEPELQPPSETDILAEELVKMKFENMQKDAVISTFGEEITKLKLDLMILKGGA